MSRKLHIAIDEESRLRTITSSASATEAEMVNALIRWAYYLPHSKWDEILKAYRDREQSDCP